MRHERDVDVIEAAAAEHHHFAAPHLFGRCAEDDDGGVGGIERGDCADGGADSGCGDEVVAACVADLGQGVVLRADGNGRRAVTPLGPKRRFNIVDTTIDAREAVRLEERHELGDGMMFL